MIDKRSLLKSQGSLYLEFIPEDGLFHKIVTLSLMGFLTGYVDCRGAVASVRDSYTDDPSSIPVRLVVASW